MSVNAVAHSVTEQAISNVAQHANQVWVAQAFDLLRDLALRQAEITADDMWEAISKKQDMAHTHEPSALGVVFRLGQSNKLIRLRRDAVKESQRPGAHRKPQRVWASLVYQPTQEEVFRNATRRLKDINEQIVTLDREAASLRALVRTIGGQPTQPAPVTERVQASLFDLK